MFLLSFVPLSILQSTYTGDLTIETCENWQSNGVFSCYLLETYNKPITRFFKKNKTKKFLVFEHKDVIEIYNLEPIHTEVPQITSSVFFLSFSSWTYFRYLISVACFSNSSMSQAGARERRLYFFNYKILQKQKEQAA